MTQIPNGLPSLANFQKMAHVDREFADARRYLSALCTEDHHALDALMVEIHTSGRAMKVLAAMAVQALDFAELSADRLGGDVQKWLNESAMAQDTAENERDESELGGWGRLTLGTAVDLRLRGVEPISRPDTASPIIPG